MSWLILLLLCPALAAPPMVDHDSDGVHVRVPESWQILVDTDANNVTASKGLITNVTMYWYPYKEGITHDIMLNIVLRSTNESLPLGEAVELNRGQSDDGSLGHLEAEYRLLGYTMKIGVVTRFDAYLDRVVAAVLVADPVGFERLDGIGMLEEIASSLSLASDPRYKPDPRAPGPEWVWAPIPEDMPLP